jgi:uncharacterized protein (DUF983 family)
MLKKGSKLNSILTGSCPQCQKESMYEDQNPYNFPKMLKMNERCTHCGLKYQIEPSFFYGAMYVSYGLNVAVGVAAFIISAVFFHATVGESLIIIIVALVLLLPIILRLSRNIYINLFVKYNLEARN